MVKIIDNVDLSALKNFDFKSVGKRYFKHVRNRKQELIIIVDNETREITCWDRYESTKEDATNYIQDIIKAGLVEEAKVVENGTCVYK